MDFTEGIEKPRPRADEVLINSAAAGGSGSLLVQLAKHKGAGVIGTASSAERLEKAIELSADVGINCTESDRAEQILQATNGKGAESLSRWSAAKSADKISSVWRLTA